MIRGETVTVLRPTRAGKDALGMPVEGEPVETAVGNVLVKPGTAAVPGGDNRPDGVTVAYTLYFPDTYTGELDGCDVVVRGRKCRVVGHPDRYDPHPTAWNMECEVQRVEG